MKRISLDHLVIFLGLASVSTLGACGPTQSLTQNQQDPQDPTLDNRVVKAQASFLVSTQPRSPFSAFALGTDQPITVVNAASVRISLDPTTFNIPTISNAVLSFGSLKIQELFDNDLKVCGNNKNQKCSTAWLRAYTTGQGEGLYNSADGYGLPIFVGTNVSSPVGLSASGASTLQSFSIPNNQRVLTGQNFSTQEFPVKIDFSQAGAGTFSTTLVLEYGLSL